MAQEEKLDWIYKGVNGLVDREEYLLGRKVDKTLEQLNDEEKEKKFVLPTPKNHVEHECIPPSIRDFNKIVQAEQVDLSTKLQEDPLVAIKKREEEARRQFLQNPVQLKKLQEALQKNELQKNQQKKKKKKDSDLDEKIKNKLKNLKSNPLGLGTSKKESKKGKDDVLNTILMHKFNALKDKLSEEDLNDILNGKFSSDSSDEEKPKKKKKKKKKKSNSEGNEGERRTVKENKYDRCQRRSEEQNHRRKSRSNERRWEDNSRRHSKSRSRSREINKKYVRENDKARKQDKYDNKQSRRYSRSPIKEERSRKNTTKYEEKLNKKKEDSDSELDRKIMAQLKLLRGEAETKMEKKVLYPEKPANFTKNTDTDSSTSDDSDSKKLTKRKYEYIDSEDEKSQKKSFGLVTSDGKRIALKHEKYEKKVPTKKIEQTNKYERKNIKKMTEEEKEKIRQEMMLNAKTRDKERERNVKKYRETDKKEEENVCKDYDADLVYTKLLKSAKHSSVEERIKSKLNNIQRSSRHMDQNFSKR